MNDPTPPGGSPPSPPGPPTGPPPGGPPAPPSYGYSGPPSSGSIPAGTGAAPLPWEDRERLGALPALFATVKLLLTAPGSAFRRTREKGDYGSPLIFAVIVGGIMAIIGLLWGLVLQPIWMSMIAGMGGTGGMGADDMAAMMSGSALLAALGILLAPVLVVVFLFIWAGIVHLCLMMVGGTASSNAGFEGTFRAVAYSQATSVVLVVPILGQFVAIFWGLVLEIIGLAELHRTTTGKAVAAVLIPIGFCCVCLIIIALAFGAAIGAMMGPMN